MSSIYREHSDSMSLQNQIDDCNFQIKELREKFQVSGEVMSERAHQIRITRYIIGGILSTLLLLGAIDVHKNQTKLEIAKKCPALLLDTEK